MEGMERESVTQELGYEEEFVEVVQMGTFDEADILEMATKGLLVYTVGWGQAVYRRIITNDIIQSDE